MISTGWNAAVQVPSASVSTYMRPPSPSTGLSAPPVKASPLSVKPPASVVMRVAVPPFSPSATSTGWGWKGGGAGGGAGGAATAAGSSPPHPAKPNASATRAHSSQRECLGLRFIILLLIGVVNIRRKPTLPATVGSDRCEAISIHCATPQLLASRGASKYPSLLERGRTFRYRPSATLPFAGCRRDRLDRIGPFDTRQRCLRQRTESEAAAQCAATRPVPLQPGS